MSKNRFFVLTAAFAVLALGVAAFGAPFIGMDSIAFAQSGSADVSTSTGGSGGSGDSGTPVSGIDFGSTSADAISAAIAGDGDLASADFDGLAISLARLGVEVDLTGLPICYGPSPSQCTNLVFNGRYRIIGDLEGGGVLVLLGPDIRVVFGV